MAVTSTIEVRKNEELGTALPSSSTFESLVRGTLKGIEENEAAASITGDKKDYENKYVNKTSLRIVV